MSTHRRWSPGRLDLSSSFVVEVDSRRPTADNWRRTPVMSERLATALIVVAALAVPLAFDPASARPFVGPKLVVALALGSLAPAAALATRGIGRLPRTALAAFAASALALAVATALSLSPVTSLVGDYYRATGLVTRAAALALALVAGGFVAADASRAVPILRAVAAAC